MKPLSIIAVLVALVGAAGCGGSEERRTPPRLGITGGGIGAGGQLVDIGGRKLFVECVGTGSPTVVLEAGFGGSAKHWAGVQPQLGRTTRTCAYDRAGLGSSVALPGVHDASDEIADLRSLLAAAHIPPPYVLVGHSYGGLLTRLFAQAHPDATAGVVLVDSMGRDQTRRNLAVWPRSVAPAIRADVMQPVLEGVDLNAGEALAARVRSLGDRPLAVVTAGRHDEANAGLPHRLAGSLEHLWVQLQDELAQLSPDHVHVVALRSDHFVQALDGQPDVVIRAVRAVVRAARDHSALPPCGRLFTGRDVRCRD